MFQARARYRQLSENDEVKFGQQRTFRGNRGALPLIGSNKGKIQWRDDCQMATWAHDAWDGKCLDEEAPVRVQHRK